MSESHLYRSFDEMTIQFFALFWGWGQPVLLVGIIPSFMLRGHS